MKKTGFLILVAYCLLAYSPTTALASADSTAESNGFIRFIEGDLEAPSPDDKQSNQDNLFDKLPETGDSSMLSSVALGFLLIGVGTCVILFKRKEEKE
ncbi:LPXTG cell wall anchor domain-containing protein [Listeria booriae]|uniref:LPXTG cell wall anchor domain-containing protein n=1 Tax=Listeria booriae TaxID=1552123 RepID=A0A842AI38_9LIST|nr:LPXTG cell wall anchor domain-containing protein [Listeria booriae]MBC1401180.1 LPXTG cell wall anchor domain-containing protein [Listeria booriae]MBC1616192.1 LPXTG cell wall anchor domain-containing protein [Listeria booriae]MBC2258491.1 LPXTG cell wall anchor domain-containing protein [Listeria booriae]MBC2320210.1 LPXTG cell wall anchor domain-containing protein [Listeria booriae]MBC6162825.1 LPXTG cell wall anchor domain-containing protein [Listeria booriae]